MKDSTAWGICVVFLIVAGILDQVESGLATFMLIAAPEWIILWYLAKRRSPDCHGEIHYDL